MVNNNLNKKKWLQNALGYLMHKALSDKSKALTSFELLLEHPAGIGDHSTGDFYKNLDEALDTLVDAEDRLEVLEALNERYMDEIEPSTELPPF
jgi:hypothetical protein